MKNYSKKIEVVDYNPIWEVNFNRLKQVYVEHLKGLEIEVVHVGSTSVVGMAAKPIIDIDIIVDDEWTLEKTIQKLTELGYIHRGNLGIVGREAFKGLTPSVPIGEVINHHLYVCMRGCDALRNHLLLKGYLEAHSDAVLAYSELKKELAEKYPYDIDAYVEGKTALITEYLSLSGMNQTSIDDIIQANKK